jgi:uncharacterized protein involved in cysteine biosynthesis
LANPVSALLRAIGQMHDPVFVGVVLRSLAWTTASFAVLLGAVFWAVHRLLAVPGWWAWAADLLGAIGTALLALWLFLPIAAGIGALFIERIALAVEQDSYPWLAAPAGAPLTAQVWDGISVGLRVLLLSCVALILALLLPGIGALLGWAISGWAIGRGLFVAVAMRRMSRPEAEALHRRHRMAVLMLGGMLALAAFLPPLNLLVPVAGVAAMVHLLQAAKSETFSSGL